MFISARSAKVIASASSLVIMLLVAACGGATTQLTKIATGAVSIAGTGGAPTPQASSGKKASIGKPTPLANCQAIVQANYHFGTALAQLVNMTTTTDYEALTRSDSPFVVDIGKVRSDLDVLASLPDPTDPTELLFGKPSDSVAYFRQLVDVAEGDIKSKGKPFNDTAANGQRVMGIDTPWMQKMAPVAVNMEKVCAGVELKIETPVAPSTFSGTKYSIGQTANDGDMRITLDSVSTVAGDANNLPDRGNRFVIFHATIANTGLTALSVPVFAFPIVNDASGKLYPFDPHTIMLSAAHISDLIGVDVPPGGKLSGGVGYQLPADVGDLTWSILESGKPPVIFAVKASDIGVVGTPINAATEDAMRSGAAATMTAIVAMVNSADATEAAMTAVPQAVPATDTPEPTDVPAATDAPAATDVPVVTDTPGN